MIVRLFAPRDGMLRHFATEEVEGDAGNPPQTFTWGGRVWRRFYEFGQREPLSYLDAEASRKSVLETITRMLTKTKE